MCPCPEKCQFHGPDSTPRLEMDGAPPAEPSTALVKVETPKDAANVTTLVPGALAWNVLTNAGPFVLVQRDPLRIQREEPTLEGKRRANHVVVEDAWTVHDGTTYIAVPAAMLTTARPVKGRLSETYVSLIVSTIVSAISSVVMILSRGRS